jgi:hypothetical protein
MEDDITFSVLGSNQSIVATFASTTDGAYTKYFANENSNLGFLIGVSNIAAAEPRWVMGPVMNDTSMDTLVIHGGNVGINTFSPTEALVVEGNAVVTGTISASNLVTSAFVDTTNATNITSGTLENERLPSTISATTFSGDGASLSNLNASYLTTGTLANPLLPSAFHVSTNTQSIIVTETGVGIGVTPITRFHVAGDILSTGTITSSNLIVLGDTVTLNTVTSNTENMVITNAGSEPALVVTQTGAQPVAMFYDDANVAFMIADGGLIGINTSNPTEFLDVVGNAKISGTVAASIFSGDGQSLSNLNATFLTTGTISNDRLPSSIAVTTLSGDGASLSNLNATYLTTGTIANQRLPSAFHVDTTTQIFTITSNANVGIGTSAPRMKFHTFGNAAVNELILNPSSNMNVSVKTFPQQTIFLPASANPSATLTYDYPILLNYYTLTGTANSGLWFRQPSSYTVSASIDDVSYTVIDTQSNLNWTILTPQTFPVSIHNYYKFFKFTVTDGTETSNVIIPTWSTYGSPIPSYQYKSALQVNGNATIGSTYVNVFAPTDGIIIAGNVGIGTTLPSRNLHVQGDVLSTAIIYANVFNGSGASLSNLNAGNISTGNLANARLPTVFNINTPTSTLTINSSCNVGIGTQSPQAKNHIYQITTNDAFRVDSINGSSTSIIVNNNGNVGIGTLTARQRFHVQGNTLISGTLTANIDGSNINSGTISADRLPSTLSLGSFSGDGSSLSNLNASYITSGTLANSRLPSDISVTTVSGDGSSLSNLNATYITSGTLTNERLPTNISVVMVSGDGSSLSNLNATYITSGTLTNARLPSDISVATVSADGSSLSNLNANYITSGTLSTNRLELSGVVAGTYGSISSVPIVTVDDRGRLTSVENSNIRITADAVNGLAEVATTGDYNSLSNITFVKSGQNAYYTTGNVGIGTSSGYTNTLDVYGSMAIGSYAGLWNAPMDSLIVSGNIGVGVGNPTVKLHVAGDIVSMGTLTTSNLVVIGEYTTLNTVTSNTENMVINNAGTGPALKVIQTGVEDIALFMDDDNVAMMIADGGFVGIGTGEPSQALEVIGNIKASGSITGNTFTGNGSSLSNLNASYVTTGTLNNDRLPSVISVGSLAGDGASLSNLNATYITTGTLANARLPSDISVSTFSGDGASLSNLNATYITSGTLANARLPSAISVTSFSGDGTSLSNLNATYITTGTLANARLPTAFNVNTTSQTLTIDANGNIGVGTSTPIQKLHIQGGILANGAILPTSCNVYDIGSAALRWRDIYLSGSSVDIDGTRIAKDTVTGGVKFVNGNGALLDARTCNMFVSGNVGIGTTIALKKLDVHGDINFTGQLYNNNTIYQGSQWETLSSNIYYLGNVGIGTDAAVKTLTVEGSALFGTPSDDSPTEYPPVALQTNTSVIHGVTYITSASSTLNPGTNYEPYKVFNKQPPNVYSGDVNQWLSDLRYNTSTGEYAGSTLTMINGIPLYGEWVQIEISKTIFLESITHYSGGQATSSPGRHPKNFKILGSTDGFSWNVLVSQSNQSFPGLNTPTTYSFDITPITYVRFVIEATNGSGFGGYAEVGELVLTSAPIQSTRVSITDAGYVGIGTSVPIASLHVVGTARFTSNVNVHTISGNGSSLSNLNASYITLGNLPAAQLPTAFNVYTESPSITVSSNGNIGIGTTLPNYKLQVQGKIFAADSITAYSDARVKTNIVTISNALHTVSQLRGVEYERTDTGEKQIGVIAQEIQSFLPQIVTEAENGLSVAYGNMVGVLIEAIKELNQKVHRLENVLANQKS